MATMVRSTVGLWLIACAIGLSQPTSAGDQLIGDVSVKKALRIMRALNTAQAELLRNSRSYGTLNELSASAAFQSIGESLTPKDSYSAGVADYQLSVITTADKSRYEARLVSDERCTVALFTNETGIIYAGKSLGCP